MVNPLFLRYLAIKPLYPTNSGQWKFWKDALFWVFSDYWRIDFRVHVDSNLYSEIPVQYLYRSRLDWVMKEHRACKRREKSSHGATVYL